MAAGSFATCGSASADALSHGTFRAANRVGASELAASACTTGLYGHMFAPAERADAGMLGKLEQLGRSLLQDGDHEGAGGPTRIAAGYTYFGQLIGHDLSFDHIPFAAIDGVPVDEIPNARTPWLDLDHVYGGGPERSPQLYEGREGAERFRIVNSCDLPRGEHYKLLGDQSRPAREQDFRGLENIIILQLHVLFMRLHNAAVDQHLSCGIDELDRLDGTVFNKAARVVRWQYQWLVRNDFLPRVLDPNVAVRVRVFGPRFQWPDGRFFIPVEFAAAAFRFGHSMVRPRYRLNAEHRADIQQLVSGEYASNPLPPELALDWRKFFHCPNGPRPAPAMGIDTRITPGLGEVTTFAATHHRGEAARFVLPLRTLQRGALMRVASGQEVARQLGLADKILIAQQLTGCARSPEPDSAGAVLADQELLEETPLFFYVLREAEMPPSEADRLGLVGSQIVADVIEGAFRHDPDSYWKFEDGWEPPEWCFPSGARRKIRFMGDLIAALGG